MFFRKSREFTRPHIVKDYSMVPHLKKRNHSKKNRLESEPPLSSPTPQVGVREAWEARTIDFGSLVNYSLVLDKQFFEQV